MAKDCLRKEREGKEYDIRFRRVRHRVLRLFGCVLTFCAYEEAHWRALERARLEFRSVGGIGGRRPHRSEEHTSELQSRLHLVCRLLLEKKKNIVIQCTTICHHHYRYSHER